MIDENGRGIIPRNGGDGPARSAGIRGEAANPGGGVECLGGGREGKLAAGTEAFNSGTAAAPSVINKLATATSAAVVVVAVVVVTARLSTGASIMSLGFPTTVADDFETSFNSTASVNSFRGKSAAAEKDLYSLPSGLAGEGRETGAANGSGKTGSEGC